jgi:hypothetical protein
MSKKYVGPLRFWVIFANATEFTGPLKKPTLPAVPFVRGRRTILQTTYFMTRHLLCLRRGFAADLCHRLRSAETQRDQSADGFGDSRDLLLLG